MELVTVPTGKTKFFMAFYAVGDLTTSKGNYCQFKVSQNNVVLKNYDLTVEISTSFTVTVSPTNGSIVLYFTYVADSWKDEVMMFYYYLFS